MRAPIEKILEILNNLTTEFEDSRIVKELKWSIEKISQNKLYEALIDEQGKNQKDVKAWD